MAFADTSPTNSPSSASGTNWITPTNVYTQNAAYASFNGTTQNNLIIKGFGFSIPAGSTINGVTAVIWGSGNGTTAARRQIRANLTVDGFNAAAANWKTAVQLGTSNASVNVGATNDIWQAALTDLNVSGGNFGVLISDNDTTAYQLNIDYVSLSIDYTPPPTCTYNNPTVSLSANQNVNQGGTNNYTLTVMNNDTSGCGNTTFTLSKTDNPSVPNANFTASTLPGSIGPIDPGTNKTVTLSHTAAANGAYGATLATYATTASDANHGAVNSNTATSTITDGYAPSSTITSPTNGTVFTLAAANTTINGTANDTTGGSGVASVAISIGGGNYVATTCSNCPTSGSTTANWTYNWTLPTVQSTNYNIQSRATDVSGRSETLGAGNILVTVDRVRPSVSSTVPTSGAANVTGNSAVTINWNENVDCATVTTSSVTISPSVTWNKTSCSGAQAVFTPSGQSGSTSYTITITTGVTDTASNAMSSSYNWAYTTGAVMPSQPTGITLSGINNHGPQINWDAVPGATQYNIYRSDDNATWGSAIGSVLDPTTTYTDNTAPMSNTKYYWTVTAQNGAGESAKPAGVSGRTALHKGYNLVSAPCNTTGLSATAVFGNWAYYTWLWQSSGSSNPDTNGTYIKPASLVPGKSVFTWAWDDVTVLNASGSANPASVTVTLLPGWNMVSNQTQTTMTSISTTWLIDGSSIMAAVNGTFPFSVAIIGGAISWWDGNTYDTGNIISNPAVEPWKGYFILNLDTVSHTLTIQ